MPQTYGYVRVSSTDQNEDRQLMAMREYSITEDRIYMDKLAGKEFSTPAVSGAAQATEARRSALYHQHRQAGPQL